jgi:hypothetical protein
MSKGMISVGWNNNFVDFDNQNSSQSQTAGIISVLGKELILFSLELLKKISTIV